MTIHRDQSGKVYNASRYNDIWGLNHFLQSFSCPFFSTVLAVTQFFLVEQ